jgi:hypothetical protein
VATLTAVQLGKRASRVLVILSLLSATVPLGVRASKRLRSLVLRNPRAVDDVKAALARVEERAAIMSCLAGGDAATGASGGDSGSSGAGGGVQAGTGGVRTSSPGMPEDMVHVTEEDYASPERKLAVVGGEGGSGEARDSEPTVAEVAPPSRSSGLLGLVRGRSSRDSRAPVFSVPSDKRDEGPVISHEQ